MASWVSTLSRAAFRLVFRCGRASAEGKPARLYACGVNSFWDCAEEQALAFSSAESTGEGHCGQGDSTADGKLGTVEHAMGFRD